MFPKTVAAAAHGNVTANFANFLRDHPRVPVVNIWIEDAEDDDEEDELRPALILPRPIREIRVNSRR